MESMAARDGATSARRRRNRQLRAFHRHEVLSVKMALATALHHSAQPAGPVVGGPEEEVENETHNAPRGHNTPPPGTRPGVLKEPGAQEAAVTVGYVAAAGAPLLAQSVLDAPVPQMVDTVLEFFRALDKPDDELVIAVPKISTDRVSQRLVERRLPQMVEQLVEVPTVVSYISLLQRKAKKKEEEEIEKRVAKHTAVQSEAAETMQRARLLLEQAGKRRKRKKRRKRRTPRTSSRSSCGLSRRRQRQWRVRHAGFAGSCAPRAVFPVAYDCPLLLGNTAGMDLKDSFFVVVMALAYAWLVLLVSLVPLCSLLSWSGPDAPHHGQYPPEGLLFSGLVLLVILHLTLCFLLVVRPLMLVGRPAGRSASWPVWTRRTVTSCRAENCGKSAVGVHQQGRLHSCRFAEVDPLV